MDKESKFELLAKYFSDECTNYEKERVETWIEANHKNKIEFDKFSRLWSVLKLDSENWDANEALKKVSALINHTESKRKLLILNRPLTRIMRYTAVFVIIIASTFIVTEILHKRPAPIYTKWQVSAGTTKEIVFPDSSKVILDAGSFLSYSDRYGEKSREIILQGEGYFEVTSNPQIPFVINTGEAVVKVIGTKFNLRSWKSSNTVCVVEEGRVLFRSKHDSDDQAVIIEQNQMSVLNEYGKPQLPQNVEIDRYLSWMQHEMYFDDIPLKEIINHLERWYDIAISIEDESFLSKKLTIRLSEKDSVEQYLNLISSILGLRYDHSDTEYILKDRN